VTSFVLKALASSRVTKATEAIEKTIKKAKNHIEITANLFFLRRRHASCIKERAGFSIFSCIFAEPMPTSLNSLFFSAIFFSLLQAYTWINYRSEEHTSELQSRFDLVCRLLLAKKKDERL